MPSTYFDLSSPHHRNNQQDSLYLDRQDTIITIGFLFSPPTFKHPTSSGERTERIIAVHYATIWRSNRQARTPLLNLTLLCTRILWRDAEFGSRCIHRAPTMLVSYPPPWFPINGNNGYTTPYETFLPSVRRPVVFPLPFPESKLSTSSQL